MSYYIPLHFQDCAAIAQTLTLMVECSTYNVECLCKGWSHLFWSESWQNPNTLNFKLHREKFANDSTVALFFHTVMFNWSACAHFDLIWQGYWGYSRPKLAMCAVRQRVVIAARPTASVNQKPAVPRDIMLIEVYPNGGLKLMVCNNSFRWSMKSARERIEFTI